LVKTKNHKHLFSVWTSSLANDIDPRSNQFPLDNVFLGPLYGQRIQFPLKILVTITSIPFPVYNNHFNMRD